MFPGRIDLVLHVIVCAFTYLFFDKFAVKVYVGFSVLQIVLLWLCLGDIIGFLKGVPIWLLNIATNLLSLFIFIPLFFELAKDKVTTIDARIKKAQTLLSEGPNFDGGYNIEGICSLKCSQEGLLERIDSLITTRDV